MNIFYWVIFYVLVLKFVGAVYPQQMPIYYRCKSMTCPLQQQLLQQVRKSLYKLLIQG